MLYAHVTTNVVDLVELALGNPEESEMKSD